MIATKFSTICYINVKEGVYTKIIRKRSPVRASRLMWGSVDRKSDDRGFTLSRLRVVCLREVCRLIMYAFIILIMGAGTEGGRGIALLILTLGARWGGWSTPRFTPGIH